MANITRYSGYSPVEDPFNEFTRGFFVKPLAFPTPSDLQVKLDVKEDIHVDLEGNHVLLRAEVKQSKEEKKDEKTIYSECSYGAVSRGFDLPTDVDAQGAKAEYKDGVLNLTLPKKPGTEARRISVV